MTKRDARRLLRRFQCSHNRTLEETFAQIFSESDGVRLFFINEDAAFTDGKNIIVDPAYFELYSDEKALRDTEIFLKWPPTLSNDAWRALRLITRAQTIHECLHILYSDIPCGAATDVRCDTANKRKIMALISNIIEDAYIEAAGCTVYDNIVLYLQFFRVSHLYAAKPPKGAADKALGAAKDTPANQPPLPLVTLLDYFIDLLLYPMMPLTALRGEAADYAARVKPLFLSGSAASAPRERYAYCQRIFDIILPLIPPDDQPLDLAQPKTRLGGSKTHDAVSGTLGNQQRKGRAQAVTARLFADLNGNPRDAENRAAQLSYALQAFDADRRAVQQLMKDQSRKDTFLGESLGSPTVHKNVQVNEIHPRINWNLQKAYKNIYDRYRLNINGYCARFAQLLKARVTITEEKRLFGAGITSRMLGDPKRRYWHNTIWGTDVPDLAVLLLIDGSGSMYGERRDAAVVSSVILHEVLSKQGMTHAIIEHRAKGVELAMDVNVLVGFHRRSGEKLNLMQIDAYSDNRDGLALLWAEKYLERHAAGRRKLLIVLSDGLPSHRADNYNPPDSVEDTAGIVSSIQKRGTQVVAVALDNGSPEDSCYESLRPIYPSLVACTDLKRLTGQILTLVSRMLGQY